MGSSPGCVKPKFIQLVFAASPQKMQNQGVKVKTDWLPGQYNMCPSEATCLPVDIVVLVYIRNIPL